NTLVAAWYGVPVVLVTGDDVAVKQVLDGCGGKVRCRQARDQSASRGTSAVARRAQGDRGGGSGSGRRREANRAATRVGLQRGGAAARHSDSGAGRDPPRNETSA